MNQLPIVHVVEDNEIVRRATISIVESMGLNGVGYPNAEVFIESYSKDTYSCLVTDLRLPGMSGLDLLRHLRQTGYVIPTIILTGFPDTPVVVESMKAGAVTFLEKTTAAHEICEAISEALQRSRQLLAEKAEQARISQIKSLLNEDELLLLQLASQGKLNKEIASELGVQIRTIEVRRSRLMAKIGANSFSDLMRFALRLEDREK